VSKEIAMKRIEATTNDGRTGNEKWLEARLKYLMSKTNRWRPAREVRYIYRKENAQEKS
jgi:hypothetical protein